jgi:hypothetical protein
VLDHAAGLEHQDLIGVDHGREPVRDDRSGPPGAGAGTAVSAGGGSIVVTMIGLLAWLAPAAPKLTPRRRCAAPAPPARRVFRRCRTAKNSLRRHRVAR